VNVANEHEADLRAQLALIAGSQVDGYIELRFRPKGDGPAGRRRFFDVCDHDDIVKAVAVTHEHYNVMISCAPRTNNRSGTLEDVALACMLWIDGDERVSLEEFLTFDPQPTMIIASGGVGRYHALWGLLEPLAKAHVKPAHERLLHKLGGDPAPKHAAAVLRPVTSTNWKHGAEVACVHYNGRRYTARDVVGHVPDPPRKTARPASVDEFRGSPVQATMRTSSACTDRAIARGMGTIDRLARMGSGEGGRNNYLFFFAKRGLEEGWLPTLRDELIEAAVTNGMPGGQGAAEATVRSAERGA
jgi:hypothetical protein